MVESLTIYNESLKVRYNFDMNLADYLLYEGSINWGTIKVSHNTFQYAEQVGETITDTIIGTRDISISGWIIGRTLKEIEEKKNKLSVLINPMHILRIEVDNWTISGKPSSNVTFSNSRTENNEKMCKFLIQIFCPMPLFSSRTEFEKKITQSIGMFKFPLIIPAEGIAMSQRTTQYFVDVINSGACEIGCNVIFRANGTVNNPTLLNINTKEKITINKTLYKGEEVIINTKKGKRSVVNQNNDNYLDYFDLDSVWIQLHTGLNTFTFYTEDEEGNRDESYKNLDISIEYNLCIMNLEGE